MNNATLDEDGHYFSLSLFSHLLLWSTTPQEPTSDGLQHLPYILWVLQPALVVPLEERLPRLVQDVVHVSDGALHELPQRRPQLLALHAGATGAWERRGLTLRGGKSFE